MQKRIYALLLAALLLLPAAGQCRAESFDITSFAYQVPNPENLWELVGEDYAFELIPQGEITAGTLEGNAYTIRFVGSDPTAAEKVAESLYVLIHMQYNKLMKALGITIEDRSVTVNGTEAELFTYPGGAQVLYAAFLPGIEPLMIIQKNSGLSLAEAKEKDSEFTLILPSAAPTEAPAPAPTSRPKAYPPAFGLSGSIGFMGQTMVTYEYRGASTDVADYITKLVDAGYKMTKQEVGQEDITMVFYNESEDIELEVYQLLLPSASNSKILITYYWICPDGEIIDGKIVKQ